MVKKFTNIIEGVEVDVEVDKFMEVCVLLMKEEMFKKGLKDNLDIKYNYDEDELELIYYPFNKSKPVQVITTYKISPMYYYSLDSEKITFSHKNTVIMDIDKYWNKVQINISENKELNGIISKLNTDVLMDNSEDIEMFIYKFKSIMEKLLVELNKYMMGKVIRELDAYSLLADEIAILNDKPKVHLSSLSYIEELKVSQVLESEENILPKHTSDGEYIELDEIKKYIEVVDLIASKQVNKMCIPVINLLVDKFYKPISYIEKLNYFKKIIDSPDFLKVVDGDTILSIKVNNMLFDFNEYFMKITVTTDIGELVSYIENPYTKNMAIYKEFDYINLLNDKLNCLLLNNLIRY